MKIKEIINLIEGELLSGNYEDEIGSIKQDSRDIKRGDTFIAFKGDEFDGNKFITQAVANGAKTCIVNTRDLPPMPINIIYVEDSVKTLDLLTSYKLEEVNPEVIAITGSVGKTSTRDILAKILSEKFQTYKNEKNYNELRGLPLTISRMPNNTEYAVLEMGMSSFGEISHLSELFKPSIAIITNIGTSHIGLLHSKENIMKAKLEIRDGLRENGLLILNNDDTLLHEYILKEKANMFSNFKILTFGINEINSDIIGSITSMNIDSMTFNVKTRSKSFDIKTNLVGKHNLYNLLPAILVSLKLGVSVEEIQKALSYVPITERRMDKFVTNTNISVFDDTYNASYESTIAALNVIFKIKNRRKVVVLGDILELGEFSEKIHRNLGKYLKDIKPDLVITAGEASQYINDELKDTGIENYHFSSASNIAENIYNYLKNDDVVLIKASNGMMFNQISAVLRKDTD